MEHKILVEKKLQEFTEYFVDEWDTKIQWYKKILEEKADPSSGGVVGSAISGSKQAVSGGIAFGTGIPILGPVVAAVYELGGKKIASSFEERGNKKEANTLQDLIFNYKGKEIQHKYRKILIEACFEIFHSYESQFMKVTAKNGGETRAMLKLAKEAVNRIIEYLIVTQEEFCLDSITKGLVYVQKTAFKSIAAKLSKSGRSVIHNNETWNTTELYTLVGVKIFEDDTWKCYSAKGSAFKKYGFRKLFTHEVENVDKIKDIFNILQNNNEDESILSLNDKNDQVERIFDIIHSRDPNKMEERLKETMLGVKKEMLQAIENIPKPVHDLDQPGSSKINDEIDILRDFIQVSEVHVLSAIQDVYQQNKQYFDEAKKDRDAKHNQTISVICQQTSLLHIVKSEINETLGKVSDIHNQVMVYTNLPIIFQVPSSTNTFIGRVTELSEIEWAHLDKKMVVLSGPKGTGKTELGVKYAQDFKHDKTSSIIFINSESHESLIKCFKDLAVIIGNSLEGKTMTGIVRETITYFQNRRTLFIFDNSPIDNVIVSNLQSFIGESENISVIITSTCSDWIDPFKEIKITNFTTENAIEYIKTIFTRELSTNFHIDETDFLKLANFHNCLPLSLNRATAHIIQSNILANQPYTIDDYINQFSKKEIVVVPEPPPSSNDDVLEKKLLKKLERETNRIGDQISEESARAEKRLKKFFSNEVARVFNW